MPMVRFHCSQGLREIDVPAGTKINQAAYQAGVEITQTCGGTPSCTDCVVKILSPDPEALEPMQGNEMRLLGNVFHITKERLSCQAVIKRSIEIQVEKIKVSKQEERE